MKKTLSVFILLLSTIFSSCYFGAFLVEQDLPGNYDLWAQDSLHQLKITHSHKNNSVYELIIGETVYAVGYSEKYIIAKSYSKKSKYVSYHIIEVEKDLSERNYGMSFSEYKSKREELNLPYNLNFTLVYHQVARN
jgi:hypothetical protein